MTCTSRRFNHILSLNNPYGYNISKNNIHLKIRSHIICFNGNIYRTLRILIFIDISYNLSMTSFYMQQIVFLSYT